MLGTCSNTQLSLQLHDVFSADSRNIDADENHAEILFHCLELRKDGRQVDLLTAPSLQVLTSIYSAQNRVHTSRQLVDVTCYYVGY